MSLDRETLSIFLDKLHDRFYGFEIVERLEEEGLITVDDVIACLEEYIIEGRHVLER